MASKLYIGGIRYSVTEAQLGDISAQHEEVRSSKVITDKFTGRSKGFGFIEMGTDDEGQKAMEALNGSQLEGRTLTVNEAREQGDRKRPAGGPGDRDRY